MRWCYVNIILCPEKICYEIVFYKMLVQTVHRAELLRHKGKGHRVTVQLVCYMLL